MRVVDPAVLGLLQIYNEINKQRIDDLVSSIFSMIVESHYSAVLNFLIFLAITIKKNS